MQNKKVLQFTPSKSSNVKKVEYFPDIENMLITFSNGTKYRYKKVPVTIYNDLIISESVGSFVSKFIVRHFDSFKEEDTREEGKNHMF